MTSTRSQRLPLPVAAATLLISVLAIGLVGCSASGTSSQAASGGSSTTSGGGTKSTAKVNPCVLSASEAGAAINEPITAAKPDAAECRYSGGGNFFSVNVFPGSTDSDWQTQLKVLNITKKATTVDRVGDKAAGSGVILDVQSGSYILNILGVDDSGTTTWPKSTALAKAIIPKLP